MENTVEVETTMFNKLLETDTATFEFEDVVDETDQIFGQLVESETVNKSVQLYYFVN